MASTGGMRGASAGSFGRLVDALTTGDEQVDGTRVADDLFGVSGLLAAEPGLRRVLTDVSLQADAKAGLVRQVFGGKLSEAALDLVAQASEQRWAATRDLGDALEQLGVIALVRSADRAGEAERLEDELFGFGRLVSENHELRDALSDPGRSTADKRALLHGLLEGRVSPAAARLAEQAVAGSHRTVAVAVAEYQKVAAEHRHRMVATVRVARPLPDQDRSRLADALAGQYDRPVHLNVVVDPRVLGGVRVEIGDDVIDGTVAGRLDDARRRLAG